MKKRLMATLLAFAMVLSVVTPVMAAEEDLPEEEIAEEEAVEETAEEEAQEPEEPEEPEEETEEPEEVPEEIDHELKDEADTQLQEIMDMKDEFVGTPYEDDYNDLKDAYIELNDEAFDGQYRYNPNTIYDLDTIGTRVELLIKLFEALRFATTELAFKIDAAHTKMAGAIAVGIVKIANPFESNNTLRNYIDRMDMLMNELLTYPELGPNDVANFHIRHLVDRELHKARVFRFHELKDKSRAVRKRLNHVILEITGLRLRPSATVQELYDAIDWLHEEMEIAKNSKDNRAARDQIKELRSLVREARKEIVKRRRNGEDVSALKDAKRRAHKLTLKIRPSEQDVLDAIVELENLLYFEEVPEVQDIPVVQ